MATFKFNKGYYDTELKRSVKPGEEVEMTITRADEVVDTVRKQAAEKPQFKSYADFSYKRTDNKADDKTDDKTEGKKEDKKADEEGK